MSAALKGHKLLILSFDIHYPSVAQRLGRRRRYPTQEIAYAMQQTSTCPFECLCPFLCWRLQTTFVSALGSVHLSSCFGMQQNQQTGNANLPMPPNPLMEGGPPTRIVQLTEAVTPEELANDEEYQDILEDMRGECGKVRAQGLGFRVHTSGLFSGPAFLSYQLFVGPVRVDAAA